MLPERCKNGFSNIFFDFFHWPVTSFLDLVKVRLRGEITYGREDIDKFTFHITVENVVAEPYRIVLREFQFF